VAGAGVLGATVLSGLIALLLVRILALAHEISPELALRLSSLSPKSLAGMTNSKHNEKPRLEARLLSIGVDVRNREPN
jgi:hypothetical protein